MKWNLRMLADAGLVVSAGKLSHLWSGRPLTVRLDDLDIICESIVLLPFDSVCAGPASAG
ncbi:hypothetical protein [Streptomyces shenzhenensis]|uniref:hypothetical protein n=1 Tax=Streptomyces shenzhenensis TaxID=943815 RepID=UPI003F5405CE